MRHYETTQSQLCNNDNDANEMLASLKIKSEMYNENICSLGFRDIREGMTLKRLVLQSLECMIVIQNVSLSFASWGHDLRFNS